jgi:hypothetical protein
MTEFHSSGPDNKMQERLPRRDWILLLLLGLLTICTLVVSTELLARHIFPNTSTSGDDCVVYDDPSTGPRGIPNSICWEKIPEGDLIKYQFNSCGHRAGMECGPKPPGTYRIVMVGTSFAGGFRVPLEKTFAGLLPAELSKRTGLKVELYNEAIPFRYPGTIARHFDEVLKAQPDLILWIVTARDLVFESKGERPAPDLGSRNLSFPVKAWRIIKSRFATKSFSGFVSETIIDTRTSTLLYHFLYSSQSQFVKSTLLMGDDKVGYLRTEPSAVWQKRLQEFADNDAALEAEAREAGIPLVTALMPNREQATMTKWESGRQVMPPTSWMTSCAPSSPETAESIST